MNQHTLSIILGYLLECYNNSIFGFFAVIIAPYFFPDTSLMNSTQASYVLFASGFFARPLGGALFGYWGDRWGRRIALKFSMFLLATSTLIMGCLPSYVTIGLSAPILFLICRCIQGLGMGGNNTGSIVYIAEQHGLKDKALTTCILAAAGFLGGLLATGVGCLVSLMIIPELSWRLVFILGGSASLFLLYYRQYLAETDDFIEASLKGSQPPSLKSLVSNSTKLSMSVFILGGTSLVPFCLATVYANETLKRLHLTAGEILANNSFILLLGIGALLISAPLMSRWGERAVVTASIIALSVLSFPLYMMVSFINHPFAVYLLQALLIVIDAVQFASILVLLPTLFPARQRYSTMGVSYAMGQALLGSTAPLIASTLSSALKVEWGPALLLVGSSILSFVAMSFIKGEPRKDISL